MVWAPSAVWDEETSQYYLFWASRQYSASDTEHTGAATTLDTIRYTTTKDFVTFGEPADYLSLPDTAIIDQEFQYLGTPGAFARFYKDETNGKIVQEMTTDGLFGTWTRLDGYVTTDNQREGPACFRITSRRTSTTSFWMIIRSISRTRRRISIRLAGAGRARRGSRRV